MVLIALRLQREADGSAHIGRTTHMNALAVRFNNVFANGKAQAGSSLIAAAGGIGAVKALKDAGQVFFFNTNAIVTDLNKYVLVVGVVNTGYYVTVLLAVFGGIFNQVNEHLF